MKLNGSEILVECLKEQGVDTIFGYPGGAIIPVYDALYDYRDKINHILVRHEQCALHAAQGYARASGRTGVCIVTSGPGATNTVTGLADALLDSTPVVLISGQVGSKLLGTDAFQEINFLEITQSVTKWNCQVKRAEDIPAAIAKAFYIASSGRPGPVVVDITKDAQAGMMDFDYKPINFIRSYQPYADIVISYIRKYNPEAKIMIQQTWSYRNDAPRLKEWGFNSDEMYRRAADACHAFAADQNFEVIPTGDAVDIFRKQSKRVFQPLTEKDLEKLYAEQAVTPTGIVDTSVGVTPSTTGEPTSVATARTLTTTGEPEFNTSAI